MDILSPNIGLGKMVENTIKFLEKRCTFLVEFTRKKDLWDIIYAFSDMAEQYNFDSKLA